ncbi:MAG: hypothetical protein QOG87_2185 [Actinomycetota bacterium]|jgi:hypothetical protein
MIGVATLLVVLLLVTVITRVATVALRTTGLSHEAARFQARSAISGVGFTTTESEDIVNEPARRRIVLTLMLISSAGLVTTLGSLLLSFDHASGVRQPAARVGAIVLGLLALWALSASRAVDRRLSALIERGLARFTELDVRDYVRLLHIHDAYSVAEMGVDEGDWLEGRPIGELQLTQEGVVVLGIRHARGGYTGVPTGAATLQDGDTVIVYGRTAALDELEQRRAGAAGERAHQQALTNHRRVIEEEAVRADGHSRKVSS